jgi:RNA polymerase sigma-70 factor (ECF subfamily)
LTDAVGDDVEASDLELWTLVAAESDPSAFALLFDRHAAVVYNYAFRRCGDWSTAEEVVAVTFLEAWRKRGGVCLDGESARPWLLGVATNVLRNLSRARRRYRSAIQRLAGTAAGPPWAEDELVARIDAERAARALGDAIGRLPKRQRDVVWLCLVEEASYREAAESLRVPVGTIRSRLSRARHQLRGDVELEPFWDTGHDNSRATSQTPGRPT